MNINELQSKFGIEGSVSIEEGNGGWPYVSLNTANSEALISVYGGQLLSYKRNDCEFFFLSEKAFYEEGKAIKGGVPICWPWFGADPENKGRSAHGFARNKMWTLIESGKDSENSVYVVLSLKSDEQTMAVWPHSFNLQIKITLADDLQLELVTQNTGNEPFEITQALHSYFKIDDVEQVSVNGLDNKKYLDKAKSNQGEENKQQVGSVKFTSEVDRIYLDVPSELKIIDEFSDKKILIQTEGNKTAVVWNPWVLLTQQSADLDDDAYKRFVCVETANAADDVVSIKPGGSFKLSLSVS